MRFIIIQVDSRKAASQVLAQFEDEQTAAVVGAYIRGHATENPSSRQAPRRGPKGNQVCVKEVAEAAAGLGIVQGALFENAIQASRAIGHGYNSIALALSKAQAEGEESAWLAGVHFCYASVLAHD